ncbi:uncharacterized protein LOC142024790 isoform X2 [Carettochelys insculpta]|uniref:uncharacterized protein LOC142024790 isoform X2 n=1 Tax=Carettochelys insculpta TaxID=44489 RepID=UPI003EBCFD6C
MDPQQQQQQPEVHPAAPAGAVLALLHAMQEAAEHLLATEEELPAGEEDATPNPAARPHPCRTCRQVWSYPTSTDWWERLVLGEWDDDRWLRNFWMSRQTFLELCQWLTPALRNQDNAMRRALSVEKRIGITVWKLATPDSYRSVGQQFGVGKATVGAVLMEGEVQSREREREKVLPRDECKVVQGEPWGARKTPDKEEPMEMFHKENLKPNRELKNIVDSLRQVSALQGEEESVGIAKCETHQEPLKLYCKNDQRPICVICSKSVHHHAHEVVPIEEAVEEYKGTIRKHLEIIESTYQKLLPLVNKAWQHLPQGQAEQHERLKTLAEKLVTTLKVDLKSHRGRLEDPTAPTRPPGTKTAGETESEEDKERESGGGASAEKQETTCKEAPAPKTSLSGLDPGVHLIRDKGDDPEHKMHSESHRGSLEDPTAPTRPPGTKTAGETESEEDKERESGGGASAEKQETTCKEDPAPKDRLSELDAEGHTIGNKGDDPEQKMHSESHRGRLEDPTALARPPLRKIAGETESEEDKERESGGGASAEKQETTCKEAPATKTRLSGLDAEGHTIGNKGDDPEHKVGVKRRSVSPQDPTCAGAAKKPREDKEKAACAE